MNGIRCPQCQIVSQLSATQCRQCGFRFQDLSPSAYVSVPIEETFDAVSMPQDNETGRKTFFWYRVYCASLVVLYLFLAIAGAYLVYEKPSTPEYTSEEMMAMGAIYAVLGAVLFIVFAVALFLPRKPFNWIVGIVLIALGMTSCCFLPAVIPLFIYWLKPETKAYFGRK